MDILISTFERAITDAVTLLTRTRFHRDAPTYLVKPQHPLKITVLNKTRATGETTVGVECKTWGHDTHLTITLTEDNGNWLAWGPFGIAYGVMYPVASLTSKVCDTKHIYPMYASHPDAVRFQELRIRSRAR